MISVQELGQQVKAKYPQYAKMDDTAVGNAVLEKYPVYKAQVSQSPSIDMTQVAGALPGIGGIIGQVLGGGLGAAGGAVAGGGPEDVPADIAGEKLGQTAGGAVGQAGGDFLKQFILTLSGQQKGFNPGEVLGEGAQGALYGAVPGGSAGGGVIKNLLTRGAGGAAVGAATQGIQNLEQGKPVTNELGTAAVAGGALNAGAGGLLDMLGSIRGKGQEVADDIENTVVKRPQQAREDALQEAHETMVSPKHVDFATENGIIDTSKGMSAPHIADAIQKNKAIGQQVEESIQNLIKGIPVESTENGELKKGFQDIFPKHGLSGINAKSLEKQVGPKEYAVIQRVRNLLFEGQQVDLSTVNQAKRLLGTVYDEKGATGEMYRYLQDFIEKKSGSPQVVKELNQQARKVAKIEQHLSNASEKGIPHRLTDQGIQEQVEKSRLKVSPQLRSLAHTLDVLGGTAGFVVGHGFLGYLIGRGLMESAAHAAETPEGQEEFLSTLKKILMLSPDKASTMTRKSARQIIEGLGIRLTPVFTQSNTQ
jgi:hypothetical protein